MSCVALLTAVRRAAGSRGHPIVHVADSVEYMTHMHEKVAEFLGSGTDLAEQAEVVYAMVERGPGAQLRRPGSHIADIS